MPKVVFTCLRRKKDKIMIKEGIDRIGKELEIDRFLKNQIKMKIAIKVLLSKVEMFLVRNNRKFVIETNHSDGINRLEKAKVSKKQGLG